MATAILNIPATIYKTSDLGLGIERIECRLVQHGRTQFGPYANAIMLEWIPKRARSARGVYLICRPYALVLRGWGHPTPPATSIGLQTAPMAPLATHGTAPRSRSSDPRQQSDFDCMIARYLAGKRGVVIADYRHTQEGFERVYER
jgi:hypothetical protein